MKKEVIRKMKELSTRISAGNINIPRNFMSRSKVFGSFPGPGLGQREKHREFLARDISHGGCTKRNNLRL
jgi:hypothetical protein